MYKIWSGRRAHQVKYENINNSNFVDMSLASFCQSRAVLSNTQFHYRMQICLITLLFCLHLYVVQGVNCILIQTSSKYPKQTENYQSFIHTCIEKKVTVSSKVLYCIIFYCVVLYCIVLPQRKWIKHQDVIQSIKYFLNISIIHN